MKKTVKKMVLNRETLRSLDGEHLTDANGGLSQLACSQPSYCNRCITLAANTCPQFCL